MGRWGGALDAYSAMNREFWKDRRVLLTGHTGFKGAWLATLLYRAGARLTGMSLAPQGDQNLWRAISDSIEIGEVILDLRDEKALEKQIAATAPQIVIHMAAQAQVRQGYRDPRETHTTNYLGTMNLLECLRSRSGLDCVLVVTSDKVYANNGENPRFDEDSPLGGSDPYSASKAATEILTQSYRDSFFAARGVPLATARAGNVIGGGDFSSERLIPDIYRAVTSGRPLVLRYPNATRPWQHVLDCLFGYVAYVEHLAAWKDAYIPTLNFGPDAASLTVSAVVEHFFHSFGRKGEWIEFQGDRPPEKQALELDNTRAMRVLGYRPLLSVNQTVEWAAEWYSAYASGESAFTLMTRQIERYETLRSRLQ